MPWLEVRPDQSAPELFARLRHDHPGVYPDGQLRTLQRRVKDWRRLAARRLVVGLQEAIVTDSPESIELD